jgi:hypothetical protein
MAGMKRVQYARWHLRSDIPPHKPKPSRWKMPEAEARALDPDARIVEGTEEWRELPEEGDPPAPMHSAGPGYTPR